MKFDDLTGKRYGKLTVQSYFRSRDKKGDSRILWFCLCNCGNTTITSGSKLKSGHTQSCGCHRREQVAKACLTHGREPKRLYSIWNNMKSRCYNQKASRYERYGGRGITICKEWKEDFGVFKEWALANGYADNLTIDRIDNDKGYEPGNCRWATDEMQRTNRSDNHYLTYGDKTLTIKEWSEIVGISDKVIRDRVNRYKWSVGRALGFE